MQLKSSKKDARATRQKVNMNLASKSGGCVIWLQFEEDTNSNRAKLSYRFYGKGPDKPLSLDDLSVAKHTKANSKGKKLERSDIRVIPKG